MPSNHYLKTCALKHYMIFIVSDLSVDTFTCKCFFFGNGNCLQNIFNFTLLSWEDKCLLMHEIDASLKDGLSVQRENHSLL